MDLRGIANQSSNVVNANITVTVQASNGTTQAAPGARRIPSYAAPVTGPAQVQALDGKELNQVSGLNIQGDIKGIYLRGAIAGVVRPDGEGGDIVTIAAPAPAIYIGTWLVVKVLESWPTFTKAAIVLQNN
jgi:hypothetical protein